jgi:phosphate-selective porin OprO and OprP
VRRIYCNALWLTAAWAVGLTGGAGAQERPESELSQIRYQLERQEAEIRRLRSMLETSPSAQQVTPLPAVPSAYGQPSESDADYDTRLSAIEKELKKAGDSAAKKKEEDALKPSVKLRGRLHTDAGWFDQSPQNMATFGDIQDGAYFRRARIGFDAKAFEVTQFRLDFENGAETGRPSIFDAYMRVTQLPYLQNVQVGHFREPFSLEALTSSNWFTFIERAPNNCFDPSRNWGLMSFGNSDDQSMTYALGAFREGSDNFGDDIGDSGEWAATGRLTWLPYYDEPSEGRYFVHLGVSGSYRDPDNNNPGGVETSRIGYAAQPEVRITETGVGGVPDFADTGNIGDASDVQLAALEASVVWGPFCIQSEYIGSNVDRFNNSTAWFHGTYVQVSYFLTGEHRAYNRQAGFFEETQVIEPFFHVETGNGVCTGSGAWEIAARWSNLDLNDAGIDGGYFEDVNLGVNWYLNDYVRVMFNYIHSDVSHPVDGDSNANIFLSRVGVWF